MKKNFIKLMTAILSVTFVSNTVYAKSIYINNEEQLNVIEKNEVYYMKDVDLFNALGNTYKFDEATQSGTVKFNGNTLTFTRDSDIAFLNDEQITLENLPLKGDSNSYNTYLMLPVLEMCELLGANIIPYTTRDMITVDYTEDNGLFKENIILSDEILYYTYDDALQLAIQNSTTIKDYVAQKSTLEFELDKLSTNYSMLNGIETSDYVKYKMNQMSIQNSLDLYDQTMANYENNIEYTLIQLLSNISLQEEKILQEEQAILLNEIKYNNNSFKYEKGDISYAELMTSENTYKNSITDLQYSKTQLNSYKEQLNLLLGLNLDDEVEVEYSFGVESLTLNIDSYASANALSSISSKNLSNELEILRFELDNYYADGSIYYFEEKEELAKNISSKNRQYKEAVEKEETAIRNEYTKLLELESKYITLQDNYEEALFNYNNILLEYNVGNVTKLEVEQMYQSLINIKYNMSSNLFNQVQVKFLLQNPNLI